MSEQFGQREYMRMLYQKYNGDEGKICAAYAQAERENVVPRKKRKTISSPEKYAAALWYDGHRNDAKRKPWLP